MKNDTYYFSHDFFARKDPKCIALIKDFGMSGYGVYWCLIEMMYEQGGKIKKFPSLFSALAHEFNVKEQSIMKQIEAMLEAYELLLQDENYIWSDTVLRRLEIREQKRLPRVQAGKAGGIKSGESRRKKKGLNQNEAPLRSNEANEAKERKGKEKKYIEPTVEEVVAYFSENGYTDQGARKAFKYYSQNDWHDSNGKKVLAWKQKMFANWFKDEFRINGKPVLASEKRMVL